MDRFLSSAMNNLVWSILKKKHLQNVCVTQFVHD